MDQTAKDRERYTERIFYEQFARNQNHHQTLFVQIGAIIVTSVGSYGYVVLRHLEKKDQLGDAWIVFAALIVSQLLLGLGAAITVAMALGFRRDQLVSSKIRVIDKSMEGYGGQCFPKNYNPLDKRNAGPVAWMPDYNIVFWVTLFLMQIGLSLSSIWLSFSSLGGDTGYIAVSTAILYLVVIVDVGYLLQMKMKFNEIMSAQHNWFKEREISG